MTLYTDDLAARILAEIEDGRSLRQIAGDLGMPSRTTIHAWLREREDFAEAYARACQRRAESLVEEALTVSQGTLERARAAKVDKAEVAAARLHVDTLMRRAAQLEPKRYSPSAALRHSGEPDGEPIRINIMRFGHLPDGPMERGDGDATE